MGVFGLCQIHALVDYLRSKLSQKDFEILFRALLIVVITVSCTVGGILTITGMDLIIYTFYHFIYVSNIHIYFICDVHILLYFKEKYHHGPDAFILCLTHLMPKIIFQLLLQFLNINQHHGAHSTLICRYLYFCFHQAYISVFPN